MYAEAVKELRRRRGWTQKQLAEATGMAVGTISQIERGRRLKKEPILIRIIRAGYPGGSLREWRKGQGWTQKQLAELVDSTVAAISQIERGRRHRRSSSLIKLLEKGLDIGL